MESKNDWIKQLQLQPHPEGGYYKEIYRSLNQVTTLKGQRSALTSIYFLLGEKDYSHFHHLSSDEVWYFHQGANVVIHCIDQKRGYYKLELGSHSQFQVIIPANTHFAAEIVPNSKADFVLVSCAVGPGFDFADFKLSRKSELLALCSQKQELIEKLTLED
jgi:predicted cupin superfamily sugar epimerase